MGLLHRFAVFAYRGFFSRFSSLRKTRFERTYRKNMGFGPLEYHMRIAEDVAKNLPRGRYKSALDMGCGYGFITAKLAEKIPRVTGVDISRTALSAARKRCKAARFVERDVVGFCSGKYDLILCVGILPYIPERYAAKVAGNIGAMLKQGGRIAVLEKTGYTGTRIENYLLAWKYRHSRKKVRVAGEDFLLWVAEKDIVSDNTI